MNVTRKALAVVVGVMLALSGLHLAQGIGQHNEEIEASILAEERTIDATVRDLERYAYQTYVPRLRYVVENNPAIPLALARRDRAALLAETAPRLAGLRAENPSFHAWDFNLPDGTVLLRVQDPTAFGDNIAATRPIIAAVHESRRPAAGYDVGRHGAIYWAAQPVFHEGRYVGATEFGLETAELMDAMRARFGAEVALLVRADRWRKAVLAEEGHRSFGDHVLIAPPGSAYAQIPEATVFASEGDPRLVVAGRELILHKCAVLPDFRGADVASLLVLQDITGLVAHRREFVAGALLASGLLLAACFIALSASLRGLIGRLETSAAETRRAKEELERSHDELERRVRERTAALEEQRGFLGTVVESLSTPFYVIDARTYRILLANRAANPGRDNGGPLTCYGMTHGRDRPCTGEDHPCALTTVRETKRPATLEHVHGSGGTGRTVQIHAYPVFGGDGEVAQVIEYCVDVTAAREAAQERLRLERQLRQAQKMEAIGTLAGGIAHDFNNILTAIYGHAELIRGSLPPDATAQRHVAEVLRAGERARDLVAQILAFSRQTEGERRPLLVHPVVKEALHLLRATLPATIEVRESIARTGPVLADPTQIHQIVMNLCTNAYHAMRERGGVLGVALAPVEIGPDDQRAELRLLAPGPYVTLEVSDTGCGMDGATLEKIFDPYFTTKPEGEGTGLGLAVVHGIVAACGGHVSVYSQRGAGTTFKVYLPRCAPGPGDAGPAAGDEVVGAAEELPRGGERILLVDDEPAIAAVIAGLLESLGYRVEAHTDSVAALRAFAAAPLAYDLVLTDMGMPGISGERLARRVLRRRPGIPVVLCTGFSELIDGERARRIGIRDFIMKPILKADLAKAVRRALDAR